MKRLFIFFMCFVMMNSAFAQAVAVSRMQSTMSGVVQQKAIQRGFAANDPRYAGTLSGISSTVGVVAGSSAAAVTVGVITAPAWITTAVACGVGLVVTYAVTLAVEGLAKWLFGDKTVDEVGSNGELDTSVGVVIGQYMWCGADGPLNVCGGDGVAMAMQVYYNYNQRNNIKNAPAPTCSQPNDFTIKCGAHTMTRSMNNNRSCAKGTYYTSSGCVAFNYPYPGPNSFPSTPNQELPAAIAKIPQSDRQKALNPEVMAGMANAMWRQASQQPGYAGIPYSPADPITAQDVATWRAANPTRYPTLGDAIEPQPAANSPWLLPSSPTVTSQVPGASTAPSTNPAASQPLTNLGPDPGVGFPTLEQTPTADSILKPILDLLPGFLDYTPQARAAECPKPSFEAFNHSYVIDTHCSMIEANKALILAFMTAAWSIMGVFIVLRA